MSNTTFSLPDDLRDYLLSVSLYDHEGVHAFDHHHQAYTFRINRSQTIRERYGSVLIPSEWRIGPVDRGSEL